MGSYSENVLESARYKVENDHKLAQSFLGLPHDQTDKDVASNLFKDLTSQYLSKLDYLQSQEELMNSQREMVQEKKDDQAEADKTMKTSANKEDTLKRQIVVQENYQRKLQNIATFGKGLLFALCCVVLFGLAFPELFKTIASKVPILNKVISN